MNAHAEYAVSAIRCWLAALKHSSGDELKSGLREFRRVGQVMSNAADHLETKRQLREDEEQK